MYQRDTEATFGASWLEPLPLPLNAPLPAARAVSHTAAMSRMSSTSASQRGTTRRVAGADVGDTDERENPVDRGTRVKRCHSRLPNTRATSQMMAIDIHGERIMQGWLPQAALQAPDLSHYPSVKCAQIRAPWTHGVAVLARHCSRDLHEMPEVVRYPRGQVLLERYRAELGVNAG